MNFKGICSYPSLTKAKTLKDFPNVPAKYSMNLMVKKGSPQIPAIEEAIKEAMPASWKGKFPPRARSCWKDGATDRSLSKNPLHHDYMFLSMSRKEEFGRPPVVDQDIQDIIDPSQIRAGMVCVVNTGFFGYEKGDGGVSANLNGVQFTGEDSGIQLAAPQQTAKEMFGDSPW